MNRFYPKKLPQVGELVYVTYKTKEDHGFICSLLEYGELEAYLPMSELSRKRIRSTTNLARVGQTAQLQVIRVDREYVDVSKKAVGFHERTICEDKYQKGKHLHSIFKQLAEVTGGDLQEIQERLLWPLYQNYDYAITEKEKDEEEDEDEDEEVVSLLKTHPYYTLRRFLFEGIEIFSEISMSEQETVELKKIAAHRISKQKFNCQTVIELTCYTAEGIDGIKKAAAGLKSICPQANLQYQAAPEYLLLTTTTDPDEGIATIKRAVEILKEEADKVGGACDHTKPIIVIED